MYFYFVKCCNASNKLLKKMSTLEIVEMNYYDKLVESYRSGVKSAKRQLPAFCPIGIPKDGSTNRRISDMIPNGMCMIDIDHLDIEHDKLVSEILDFCNKNNSMLNKLNVEFIYVTCSGKGVRIIAPLYENHSYVESAVLLLDELGLNHWIKYLDTVTTDISRLSIISSSADYIWCKSHGTVTYNVAQSGNILELNNLNDDNIKDWVKSLKDEESSQSQKNANESHTQRISTLPLTGFSKNPKEDKNNASGEETDSEKPIESKTKDNDNQPFKSYSNALIERNDSLYAEITYKGRALKRIADTYVLYRTKGKGPEEGERHILYTIMAKNFRNLVVCDPRKLHAVLPTFSMPLRETWDMCCYYCSISRTNLLPKEFYFWMQQNNYMEEPQEEIEAEEDRTYKFFIDTLPPLPPILKEYVDIAPYWFKIPTITTLQCYCGLLATNTRAYYFDGSLLSTTLYSLVYAPAASGKSYVRRLRSILKTTELRDKLAIQKAKWYEQQVRENNGSGRLPKEILWKQRIFASKTSLGEILKRQEAIGQHHWLQDVGEFSIWAATIKKAKEEWSAFFRTSYDNDEFMQSYQSPNAYRGKVEVYPIIHGTCTIGQINSFFTDLEDGLLTRFAYVPLLHQRYSEYQPWDIMSKENEQKIDKVVSMLDEMTYIPDTEQEKKKKEDWDYLMKDPVVYDLSFLFEPLHKWLLDKLNEARKQDNEALDMFRRRCARNAFVYGMICYALFGYRNDAETKEKIIKNMLWDAEVKLYYMRYMWEKDVIDDISSSKRKTAKGVRNVVLYDLLSETFSRENVEQLIIANGYKSRVYDVISSWLAAGIITKVSKNSYKKIQNK